ncbi:MAG TPA: glycerol-3-phosphate dehydrogenase/oxidase [Pseudomonadales bacterium]
MPESGPPATATEPARLARRPVAELAGETFDLVVVGGGITGAGVARHAAAAGLRTVLLDADDFASGTSSRSTKLIHGGLRYLAMGDFGLVREGALERKSLHVMAPHLTEPRWMLVPARSRIGRLKLQLGIGLYERLGAVPRADRHRRRNAADLAEAEPLLRRDRLPWACVYREYLTDDARLVLATLRAAAARGAETCNYAAVTALRPGPRDCLVVVSDRCRGGEVELRARCVVNAAGPWVEELLPAERAMPLQRPRIHLSKGVHAVLDRARLPIRHMVMMTAADGRPVFAIARGAVTYLGTTDTSHGGPACRWPAVTATDVDYLLTTANAHFAIEPLTAADVLATWAGLRPLIHQPGKAPKEMSRRDEIWREGRLVTIAGGKLTGFRKMAEAVMAVVGTVLERDVAMADPLERLPGGELADVAAAAQRLEQRHRLAPATAERLVRLYGSEAEQVLGPAPQPLTASTFVEELDWAATVEGARTLEDVVYRRLRAAWFLPDEVEALLQPAAARLAARFGWSEMETAEQVARVRDRLAAELAFRHSAVSGASR